MLAINQYIVLDLARLDEDEWRVLVRIDDDEPRDLIQGPGRYVLDRVNAYLRDQIQANQKVGNDDEPSIGILIARLSLLSAELANLRGLLDVECMNRQKLVSKLEERCGGLEGRITKIVDILDEHFESITTLRDSVRALQGDAAVVDRKKGK
jgi:hypothetical protein